MARSPNADFWSRVLKEKGLESPGREEAVRETLALIQQKKNREEKERQDKKANKRKK